MTIERTKAEDPIAAHWSSATPDQVDAARTRVLNRLQFPVEADLSTVAKLWWTRRSLGGGGQVGESF